MRIACSCILAALCSFLGDLLQLSSVFVRRNQSNSLGNFDDYKELDQVLLEEDWKLRRNLRPLDTASGLFSAASWVIFCIPILHLVHQLSRGGQHLIGLHATIAILTITGAIAEFVSHVMYVGSITAMEWISTDFNLNMWVIENDNDDEPDYVGWRALEVIYISMSGMLFWINALEWIFFGFILFLMFLSIRRQVDGDGVVKVGTAFGGFCIVMAVICFVEFAFEVLRFKSWRLFTRLTFYVSVISRLTLWPIWFLWLGRQVARVREAGATNFNENSAGIGTTDFPKQTPYPTAPTGPAPAEASDFSVAEPLPNNVDEDKPGLT